MTRIIDFELGDSGMTLAEHANAWCQDQGRAIPSNPIEWTTMYQEWIEFAFGDFSD